MFSFIFLKFDVSVFSGPSAEIPWSEKIIPAFYTLVSTNIRIFSHPSCEATIILRCKANYASRDKAALASGWWPDTFLNNLLIQLWHGPSQAKAAVDQELVTASSCWVTSTSNLYLGRSFYTVVSWVTNGMGWGMNHNFQNTLRACPEMRTALISIEKKCHALTCLSASHLAIVNRSSATYNTMNFQKAYMGFWWWYLGLICHLKNVFWGENHAALCAVVTLHLNAAIQFIWQQLIKINTSLFTVFISTFVKTDMCNRTFNQEFSKCGVNFDFVMALSFMNNFNPGLPTTKIPIKGSNIIMGTLFGMDNIKLVSKT